MCFARLSACVLLCLSSLSAVAAGGAFVAPESAWLNAERQYARAALDNAAVDFLVMPVEGGENTFDPIERSLIMRIVSDRILHDTKFSVPNPTFVIRELGMYRSTYPTDDVRSLVSHVNAAQIVEMRVEHNRAGTFELAVTIIDGPRGSEVKNKTWQGLEYSDARPPFMAVYDILDDLVEFATGERPNARRAANTMQLEDLHFPATLEALQEESEKTAEHAAAYLQLVGMLHPSGFFNETRDQLFIRSLVTLGNKQPDTPARRYLAARALAYLGRRPAAVEALGKPGTDHEKALLAALNGNLPQLRVLVDSMGTSALGFMALRDLQVVESDYRDNLERASIEQFAEENAAWGAFIYRALRDTERWANYSAATVKLGLEQLMPTAVPTLQDWIDKASVTGEFGGELELTRMVWRHVDSVGTGKLAQWAMQARNHARVSELDIIDLARSIAVANQVRRTEVDLTIRGSAESALRQISEFETLLSGHPAVALQRGRALEKLAEKSAGAEEKSLRQQAAGELLSGFAWTGQMTPDAVLVAHNYNRYLIDSQSGSTPGRMAPKLFRPEPNRFWEWPRGEAWFQRIPPRYDNAEFLQTCVDYSWTAFYCLQGVIERTVYKRESPTDARAELLAKYAHRFIGNPEREDYEVRTARADGDEEAEIRILRERVAAGSRNWPIYYALGRALKRRGDYAAAQDTFLSYPGFASDGNDDSLTLSNYAYDAGSIFYWVGQYELALPLLEMSASSNTGSAADMSSGVRISLIVGDLEAAEAWSAARVRRYGEKYAIRDLQQILHIRGQSGIAWSIFDQSLATMKVPQIWSGALIGHQMEAATTQDIVDWIDASEPRKTTSMHVGPPHQWIKMAPRYLLLAGTMDRRPGQELAAAISRYRFEQPPTYSVMNKPGSADYEPEMPVTALVHENRTLVRHDDLVPTPPGGQAAEDGQEIASRYEMLADAMAAFLSDDHDRSFELFNRAAYYYMLDEYLPYYAYSASKAGHAAHIPHVLESREPIFANIRETEQLESSDLGYRFDEDLTYAVLAAFDADHGTALKYLRQALNNRPYMDERSIFPYYQVVDLADRLYEQSGVNLYRDFALDLARRHTIVLPMYAWAYFVVAQYSDSDVERLEATASGLKLDPLSYRATKLPDALIDRARQYLEEHGAPYLRRTAESLRLGT